MKRILLLLLAATAAVSVTASSRTDGKQTLSGKPASFQGGDMFAFSRYVRENLTFSGDCYQEGAKPGGSFDVTRLVGFVGNLGYTYDNRFLLDASVRSDGSSIYG